MNDPINFDIEGLAVRYELHPERRDVFVEGDRDQGLIRGFLAKQGKIDVWFLRSQSSTLHRTCYWRDPYHTQADEAR